MLVDLVVVELRIRQYTTSVGIDVRDLEGHFLDCLPPSLFSCCSGISWENISNSQTSVQRQISPAIPNKLFLKLSFHVNERGLSVLSHDST